MDLLVEKGDIRTYLSRYKVITTSFEESSPSVKRNNTQIQYRNGNIDFGGWNEAKAIDYVGYYRADDIDEEETLREKIYALLSDPDGYYITQLKNGNDNSYERPGENTGDYFEKQVNRPSHKRFYVYASSLESELVGSYGGHVLYKISATFTTMKLPYGESVPRDLDIKHNVTYYGGNLLIGTGEDKSGKSYTISAYQISGGLQPETTYTLSGLAKIDQTAIDNQQHVFVCVFTDDWSWVAQLNIDGSLTENYDKLTFTTPSGKQFSPIVGVYLSHPNGDPSKDSISGTGYISKLKLEKGSIATPWSPAPEDLEYNAWYTKIYYNTDSLVIPYAGTVPCNQLEQGFTVEFTAKEAGSNLKLSLNGTDFIAPGNVSSGDVFKLSGYEYLRNGISIVKATNKAWFKLLPGIANKISSSIAGEVRILNFQNLYA